MKYIIPLFFLLIGCSNPPPPSVVPRKECIPKFAYTQFVKYKVPEFFRLVCAEHGFIKDYSDDYGKCIYLLTTSGKECPRNYFKIAEEDIQEAKK